ncbi:MAG: hypothetical protein RR075_00040, partial [Pygmaiobacter sp.]
MMESERFAALCAETFPAAGGGIGTLGEKQLHAVFKRYCEPRTELHEIKLGRYVADIYNENGVTEIQTGSFSALRKKLPALLAHYPVTLVHPLAATKYLRWIDPLTGAVSERRRSPKRGDYLDAFYQLCHIPELLSSAGLSVTLYLVDLEEYRLQNGWGNSGKRGSVRVQRMPLALVGERILREPRDYLALLPQNLPDPFTTTELRRAAKRSAALAAKAVHTLTLLGALQKVGKRGNSILYSPATQQHTALAPSGNRPERMNPMKLPQLPYQRP